MEPEEIILTVVAIVISFIALGFTIREGRLSQKHNRLSVKPVLGFSLLTSAAYSRYSLILENYGLGPALIKSYKFLVDGKSFDELKKTDNVEKWEELSSFIGFPNKLDWHYLHEKDMLKPGDKTEIVGFKCDVYSDKLASTFRQAVRRLTIIIEYTSMYEIEIYPVSFIGVDDVNKE